MEWSYYVYIVEICINIIQKNNLLKEVIYLGIFNLIFIMWAWSFVKTKYNDVAVVPTEFKIPLQLYQLIQNAESEEEKNQLLIEYCVIMHLPIYTRNQNGSIRYCKKCKQIKPDRTHHCSTCGTCVLKMDHHCQWVNSCIGFSNYKYFVLLLIYSTAYCGFYIGTTTEFFFEYYLKLNENLENIQIVIAFILTCVFGILFLSFACFHLSQIGRNKTTLETIQEPKFSESNQDLSFDLGRCNNFVQVFGSNLILALLPINTNVNDGIRYPFNSNV